MSFPALMNAETQSGIELRPSSPRFKNLLLIGGRFKIDSDPNGP
jgi:hypothetical protein